MDKRPIHRFKIWDLAKNRQAEAEKPKPVPARGGPAQPVTRVDDLAAMIALYHHGPLIEVELRGTCTMPDGGSTKCKTKTISPEAVNLGYDVETADPPTKRSDEILVILVGSAAHLDLDRIGAFRGVVTSQNSEGFRVAVNEDCKPMLRNKLIHMAADGGISLDDASVVAKSSITRIEPNIKSCSFTDHTGTLRKGKIVNVSQIDALIKTRFIPPLTSRIVFRGSRRDVAEVTHTFEIGFAVRFCTPIPAEEFSATIKFSDE